MSESNPMEGAMYAHIHAEIERAAATGEVKPKRIEALMVLLLDDLVQWVAERTGAPDE